MLLVAANYGQETKCFACMLDLDTNQHLLECVMLKLKSPELIENTKIIYDDIFSTNIKKVVKTYKVGSASKRNIEKYLKNKNRYLIIAAISYKKQYFSPIIGEPGAIDYIC